MALWSIFEARQLPSRLKLQEKQAKRVNTLWVKSKGILLAETIAKTKAEIAGAKAKLKA